MPLEEIHLQALLCLLEFMEGVIRQVLLQVLVAMGVYGTTNGGTYRYGVRGVSPTSISNSYGVFCDGNGIYSGTWSTVSDQKFKTNIQPLSNSLDQIMNLKPYSYDYNTEEFGFMNFAQGKQFGFIAQDLAQVLPELTDSTGHAILGGDSLTGSIEFMSVNYIGLIPVLTKAMQEQQVIIEEQSELLKTLMAELEVLKHQMK